MGLILKTDVKFPSLFVCKSDTGNGKIFYPLVILNLT